jgi:hypothetical protein
LKSNKLIFLQINCQECNFLTTVLVQKKDTMNNFENSTNGEVYTYSQYLDLVNTLVAEKKGSFENTTEEFAGYTSLNQKRMKRIDKTVKLTSEIVDVLNGLEDTQEWFVITEAWCGDSAQNLPVLAKIAEESKGKIKLNIILRDSNLVLMDKYLTNGGRSIPKLVAFDKSGDEMFTWGPRPKEAQNLLLNWKENPEGKNWNDFERDLHTWYAKNKAVAVQEEIIKLLSEVLTF